MADSAPSSLTFLSTGRVTLANDLSKRLLDCKTQLTEAETEKANWNRLDGTPGVHDATKNRHIKPHLSFWVLKVQQLKNEIVELETDINSLALIR